jgi:hypothetical protein
MQSQCGGRAWTAFLGIFPVWLLILAFVVFVVLQDEMLFSKGGMVSSHSGAGLWLSFLGSS